jgi:hypothetical protein
VQRRNEISRFEPLTGQSSWERWRLAGELRFPAANWPAGRRRSQEVHEIGWGVKLLSSRQIFFKLFLGKKFIRRRNELFFEMDGRWSIRHRSQTSGNPVKIRDGCATVTATNSQGHCSAVRDGKAGRRFEAEVRIPVWLCSSG